MPTLLFKSAIDDPLRWKRALEAKMPDLEVCVWPECGNTEKVEYALVWGEIGDMLRTLPNLKIVFSLGAGVDHLLPQEGLPRDVPTVRMLDAALTQGMSEYLMYHVLRFHRRMSEYESQQRARVWRPMPQTEARDCRIGIMGLGVLGGDAAEKFHALGFPVSGWSRGPKSRSDIRCYHGKAQLKAFLRDLRVLVCLLPLTADTTGIINRDTLAALPRGACVVNAARGGHVVDNDLLAALDAGDLAGAVLDVFEHEPLPASHPFWSHPRVTLTPHIASLTNPDTAASHVVDNVRRQRRGEPLVGVVDAAKGY